MPKSSKKMTTVWIVVVCIALVGGIKIYKEQSKGLISMSARSKVKGNNDAPLKITEFIDFQCPACARGSQYLGQMIAKHPQLIRLQLKHFPLAMHSHGQLSAQYAECAARQGKFWPFHDLLLQRQGNWKKLDDAVPAFNQIANEVKLNSQELASCLSGSKANRTIEKNKAEGRSLNIRSTPTYLVNGKMVVGMQSLQIEINNYLNENRN